MAMPFSIRLVGMDFAKPILNMLGLIISLMIVIKHFKEIQWKVVLFIGIFMLIGFGLGYLLDYLIIHDQLVYKIYGGIVILIAIVMLFVNESWNLPNWLLALLLILSGVFQNLYLSGGPFLVIFAHTKLKEPGKFRASLSFCWVILNGIFGVEHIVEGKWTLEMLYVLLIAAVTLIISYVFARHFVENENKRLFHIVTCILLVIAGTRCLF